MQGYIQSTFFTRAGLGCLQVSIGLLLEVTHPYVDRSFQFEIGFCIRVPTESRTFLP
jgi:hypothetical protein